MYHSLKILKCYYDAVVADAKNFEIRDNNDRGFQKGDTIKLREIDQFGEYTGRKLDAEITYVTNYAQKEGYVVFAFKKVHEL